MKSFVITIKDLPQSVESAKHCIDSAKQFNINVEMFDAITPKDNPEKIFKNKNITSEYMDEIYSNKLNCMAAFLSHYTLWQRCIEDNEEYVILEHDAVFIDKIPQINFDYSVINIGKPSYGKFNTPNEKHKVFELFSKNGGYFPGAHAYMLKPIGAQWLIYKAEKHAKPTDLYLNKQLFPWLAEYYPWPVEAQDNYTTIQNEKGCIAKHNYNEAYKEYRI